MRDVLMKAVGLHKRFGKREVVKGVSMEIHRDEIVAVIGPNGAGKSTTLDMILGLKKADAGTVEYWRSEYRKEVGVQLQSTPFFPGLSAIENIKLFASFYKMRMSREDAMNLLRLCGLGEAATTDAARLSGGQQKRLAIAIALVHNPKLVFLDEPSAALDPISRREIHALIRKLAEGGTTVVFTSHDMEEVSKLAKRLVMIDAGRIVAEGTPETLCAEHGADNLEELYIQLVKGQSSEEVFAS